MLTDTTRSPYAHNVPLGSRDVSWTGGFWKEVQDTTFQKTVPTLRHMFDSPEISHVVENFRSAAGLDTGEFSGYVFGDGDFYKWLEAAMYDAVLTHDDGLLSDIEDYIALIGKAQQPDGYLSTKQIIGEREPGGARRMGDINDFEVYNFGHLFTSAALYLRLTGRDSLLRIASRTADYLAKLYAEAERTGNIQTAVCPSHYMGLVELYRATGEERYLALAEKAVALRDRVKHGLDDNQDRLPLRQHRHIIGHAVRANYLYAGVADLYLETGDPAYAAVLRRMWDDLTAHKIYITGGCGALYNGASPYGNFFDHQLIHQAYGYSYQLPNVTAYNEACAGVGLVMWAYRMFLADPQAQYMDVIERVMLNTNLAAVSLDGTKFFYENMLERDRKLDYRLVWPLHRTGYITSYCCPPNLARSLAQSSEYAYTVAGNTVYTGMYGASRAGIRLPGGADFVLEQETDYPFDGRIVLRVTSVRHAGEAALALRIPTWAEGARIVCGEGASLTKLPAGSYQTVPLTIRKGETVTLELPMRVRYTASHDMVEEDRGKSAVERGPLVYCVETADLPEETGAQVHDLYLSLASYQSFVMEKQQIRGREVPVLRGIMKARRHKENEDGALYYELHPDTFREIPVTMVPYYAWDNRSEETDHARETDEARKTDGARETDDAREAGGTEGKEDEEMRVWFPLLWD